MMVVSIRFPGPLRHLDPNSTVDPQSIDIYPVDDARAAPSSADVIDTTCRPPLDDTPTVPGHQCTNANPNHLTQILSHRIADESWRARRSLPAESGGGVAESGPATTKPRYVSMSLDENVGAVALINGRTGMVERLVSRRSFDVGKLDLRDIDGIEGDRRRKILTADVLTIEDDQTVVHSVDVNKDKTDFGDPIIAWSFAYDGNRVDVDVDSYPKNERRETTAYMRADGRPSLRNGERSEFTIASSSGVDDSTPVEVDRAAIDLELTHDAQPGMWLDASVTGGRLRTSVAEGAIREPGTELSVHFEPFGVLVSVDDNDGSRRGNESTHREFELFGGNLRRLLDRDVHFESKTNNPYSRDSTTTKQTIGQLISDRQNRLATVFGLEETGPVTTDASLSDLIAQGLVTISRSDDDSALIVDLAADLLRAKPGGDVVGWVVEVGAKTDGEWTGKRIEVTEGRRTIGNRRLSIPVENAELLKNAQLELRLVDDKGFPVKRATSTYGEL